MLRPANHLIAENDADLTVGAFALDGFKTRLLGRVSVDPLHVVLEFAHQEQDPDDRQGPHDENAQEERLVWGHGVKCRV